jgi:glycosyltransferase involved in cell wall biosynthesis
MNKKDLKILCLSFWTPPLVRPQSILIGKMIPEWIRQGIKTTVVTYDVCGDWDINIPVYKIPQYAARGRFISLPIVRNIREWLYYEKIYKVAKKIIKKHDLNIVFSFSNPQESNILGAMLKKRLGIKFISYFSDPWYDNPYKKYPKRVASKIKFFEEFIIKWSDKIIFTNEQALKLVMKKYLPQDQKKALVIPHCYNKVDYPVIEKKSLKFILSYIGAFYKERNPEMIFMALQNIIKNNPEFEKKLTLQLVGSTNVYAEYSEEILNTMVLKYGLKNMVEIIPEVSYVESLKYMKMADCLIAIDADFPHSPFLPSKVIDYAGSGKVIVGITPQDSPTAIFLKRLGYQTFTYNELGPLANYFESLVNGIASPIIDTDYIREFDVKTTTAKLIGLFEEVTK